MRFLIIGDIHYTRTPPERRKENYAAQVLEKLQWCAGIARKLSVEGVILTGDLFHKKRPSLADVSDVLTALQNFPCGVGTVVGNHDIIGHNAKDLTHTGIGLLFKSPHLAQISQWEDGYWNAVTAVDYCVDYEAQDAYTPTDIGGKPQIHVTHGLLTETDLPFAVEHTTLFQINEIPEKTLLINGHWHRPWQKGNVWNIGSLSRTAIDQDHQPRVLFAQWHNEQWKVREIPVPVAEDVWTEEDHRPLTMDSDAVREFVERFSITEDIELRSQELLEKLMEGKDEAIKDAVRALMEYGEGLK